MFALDEARAAVADRLAAALALGVVDRVAEVVGVVAAVAAGVAVVTVVAAAVEAAVVIADPAQYPVSPVMAATLAAPVMTRARWAGWGRRRRAG